MAAIACEEQGLLPTLKRAEGEGEDFIEALSGKCWDVKTAPMHSLDGKMRFNAKEFVESIKSKLLCNPNALKKTQVIVDITYLGEKEINQLYRQMTYELTKEKFSRTMIIHRNNPTLSMNPTQFIKYLGI